MQDKNLFHRSRKIILITLGAIIAVAIAAVTVYALVRVVGPASNSSTNDDADSSLTFEQQLDKLYKENDKEADQQSDLTSLTIYDSGTEGYKNARARIATGGVNSGLTAYFYQTAGGKWHFFTATKNQDELSCKDYDSEDLINAFLGFTCKDPATGNSSFVEHPQIPEETDLPAGGSGG